MNEPVPRRILPTPAGDILLRSEEPGDELFLFEVYAASRQEEMNLTNWDAATRNAFLTMQFKAMRQAYAGMFSQGVFSVIELDGRSIGRQVVDENDERICVVDVALVPGFQNRKIGSALMRDVIDRARHVKKPIELHVLIGNRAIQFYERFGFQPVGEAGVYQQMAWTPPH